MNLEIRGHTEVCELRLAAPPGNIIDRALCLELSEAIQLQGAERSGLATRLCDDGELGGAVSEFLEQTLLPRSAAALRLATRTVRSSLDEERISNVSTSRK